MGWTRKTCRAKLRHRRPDLESLESRELLTASHDPVGIRHGHAVVEKLSSHPSPVDTSLNSGSSSTGDLINAAQARSTYHVDGTGMTVAVIDTGVDYNNQDLGAGFGPGNKVVAGYDFTQNDGDPLSTNAHGTAVAGLIASNDPSHSGVAPGADLAALRVFNNESQGGFGNVVEALQWVIDNHDKYNITTVNLSLADGNNYAQNWFAQDNGVGQQITGLVAQLDALNIPVIAATGNSFNGQQGEGFPAIIPDTISVTSTNAAGDQLSSTAQRLGTALGGTSATDIAAPGEGIVAPVPGNQFATVDGTSFAAPQVSGAVVLLQQIYESRFGSLPTVAQLDNWLQEGSDPVSDPVTHLAIGRLDVAKAASFIPTPQPLLQILTPPSNPQATSVPTPDSSAAAASAGATIGTSNGINTSSTSNLSTQAQQPAASTTPASTATSVAPPVNQAVATTNGQATSASVNGQSPDQVDPNKLSSSLGSLYSLVSGGLKSLSGWANSPSGSSVGKVRIWTNSGTQTALGNSQPTGQIKSVIHVTDQGRTPSGPGLYPRHSPFVRGGRHR
jgi:type VI secretion system secreted protein VgrG